MTTYYEFKRFEETAERLGMRIKPGRFGNGEVGIYPQAEKWPPYSADFEMWSGDINNMIAYMVGLEKGLEYAKYLGWKRGAAEKKYQADIEKKKVKHEQNRTLTILKDKNAKDPGAFKECKVGGD